MRALLVTSRVTFVPNNYDDLVCGLASCDHVGGLLVLDNADHQLAVRALGLWAAGARGIGAALLRNQLGGSMRRRRAAFAAAGKPVWVLPTINCDGAVRIVRDGGFDLVINARTRFIYKDDILAAPRLGCINVHHGLLPEQRGAMCDLWSLYDGTAAGFSIHQMTSKLDDGAILARVQVSDGSDRDYPAYLAAAARRELDAVRALLADVAARDRVAGTPNTAPPELVYRKTPGWKQVTAFRRKGVRV